MKNIYALLFALMTSGTMFGQLIINEVLYDPSNEELLGDANGDGVYDQEEDSFIEFVNTAETNFNISGYQIFDTLSVDNLQYTFPEDTYIPPGGALVVFGGGTPTGDFGGAIVLTTGDPEDGMNLNNSGEIIAIVDPEGNTAILFDSDALSNNPNESYTRNPDVTGEFEQHNDNTELLFSPGTMIDGTPFNTAFVVESVDVMGAGGVSVIDVLNGNLQMEATVMPDFASNIEVDWSVTDGNSIAEIDANGLLTALGTADGVVTVTATSTDGTDISGSTEITISNQTLGLFDQRSDISMTVYPNPATDLVRLDTDRKIDRVEIYNLKGQLISSSLVLKGNIDVSQLEKAAYIMRVFTENEMVSIPFIKE